MSKTYKKSPLLYKTLHQNAKHSGIASRINMSRMDFSGIDLSGVSFFNCDFSDANFSHAMFRDSSFYQCNFTRCELYKANLACTDHLNSLFRNASLRDISLYSARMKKCKFLGNSLDLKGMDVTNLKINDCVTETLEQLSHLLGKSSFPIH